MIVALCLTTEKKNARPIELIEKVSAVCYLMTSKKDLKKCHLIEKRLFPSVERRIKTRKLTGDNPQYKIVMSKEEAIQAMKEGKKVTHRFFSSDEWMTIENGFLLLEDGVRISLEDFFNFRSDSLWDNGYELYNPS